MFATRCKLRRPGAFTTVGSSRTSLARRCLGTAASPEARGRDDDNNGDEGDGSARYRESHKEIRSANEFAPLAYEPMHVSYADILSRAISKPVTEFGRVVNRIRRALQTPTEDPPLQPQGASLPLEHALSRSIRYLEVHSARIHGALSAVTKDLSRDAVPEVHAHTFAALRAHHLGRWYAETLAPRTESRAIGHYLNNVADATEKARNIIISHSLESINGTLFARKAAVRRAIHEHRRELQAVVYSMVCELRAARRARQWHKVWMLERKVASTATMFLPSEPLGRACHNLLNRDDEIMTEISMSRMAEWNDSYQQMYEEDVRTRKGMNLVKRYWTVLSGSTHEKPWKGKAAIFTVQSATKNAKELVVIRYDKYGTPSPLWPRIWRPLALGGMDGVARTTKQRAIPTPSQTGWRSKLEAKKGKGPRDRWEWPKY